MGIKKRSKERIVKKWIDAFWVVILMVGSLLHFSSAEKQALANSLIYQEGNDFATQVLGDPWDMNEFSDIGTYLNNSNQTIYLKDVSVINSVFSATSATDDPQFTLLFPGYLGAIPVGKVGANYPIDSSKYKCLYLAMDVRSPKLDYYEVYWFADNYLNGTIWGTTPVPVSKDYGWNLYSINLADSNNRYGGNTRWSNYPSWQGLRIDPSVHSSSFSIDWVRLTDCQPVNFQISNLPSNTPLSLYLETGNKEIRISETVQTSSGFYTFDLQGIAAGSYTYKLRSEGSSSIFASGQVEINQSPIATFINPSGWSGSDYSETYSIPWDMETPDSVNNINCADSSFNDGILNIRTNSKENLPSSCLGGGYADPKIFLTSLKQVNSTQYRYLNFKMNADGDLEDIPNGMIARFIWTVAGSKPGLECHMVSRDIPFGVGENIYTIDLFDAFNGQIVEKAGSCLSDITHWYNSGNIISFRFDPNENQLGRELNQQIDWIRLTQQNSIRIGEKYYISLNLNKSFDSINSWTFYYTTTPSVPQQHSASVSMIASDEIDTQHPETMFSAFLPLILSPTGFIYNEGAGEFTFKWDTNGVAPGEYYVCVELNDGLNSNVFCSDVTVMLY